MSWWKVTVLILVVTVLGVGVYDLHQKRKKTEKEVEKLQANLEELISENQKLDYKIDYLKKKSNLTEEARENFNYRKPGEKMMILVPSRKSDSEE